MIPSIFPSLSFRTFILVTGSAQYKGFADCLAKIYRQEGIRGWYKVSSLQIEQLFFISFVCVDFFFCKTFFFLRNEVAPVHYAALHRFRALYQVCLVFHMVLYSS